MSEVERHRYYPEMPPALSGESDDAYTDRLTGADRTNRVPYDHSRNRQCSIGYHNECSDPSGLKCKCPCHAMPNSRTAAEGGGDFSGAMNPNCVECKVQVDHYCAVCLDFLCEACIAFHCERRHSRYTGTKKGTLI